MSMLRARPDVLPLEESLKFLELFDINEFERDSFKEAVRFTVGFTTAVRLRKSSLLPYKSYSNGSENKLPDTGLFR